MSDQPVYWTLRSADGEATNRNKVEINFEFYNMADKLGPLFRKYLTFKIQLVSMASGLVPTQHHASELVVTPYLAGLPRQLMFTGEEEIALPVHFFGRPGS